MAVPLLGGDIKAVRFRLSRDAYFKTSFRYRVKNENGGFDWEDFPLGAQLEIRYPHPDGVSPDFAWAADSIVGQYARFIVPETDVNDVLDALCVRGQVWFDDSTGFDLVASGEVTVKD